MSTDQHTLASEGLIIILFQLLIQMKTIIIPYVHRRPLLHKCWIPVAHYLSLLWNPARVIYNLYTVLDDSCISHVRTCSLGWLPQLPEICDHTLHRMQDKTPNIKEKLMVVNPAVLQQNAWYFFISVAHTLVPHDIVLICTTWFQAIPLLSSHLVHGNLFPI